MCLGAISITSEREEAVDFTKPFKQKEFNLLMKKPKEKTSIFQFLWPLHAYVWLTTISAMLVVANWANNIQQLRFIERMWRLE